MDHLNNELILNVVLKPVIHQVEPLYSRQAKDQLDFIAVRQASIIMPDGATEVLLPVMVLADDLPELEEELLVVLTQVSLVGGPSNDPSSAPTLGTPHRAIVAIARNDNANGVFKLHSRDPRATEHGQVILVDETEKFFVELVVERLGEFSFCNFQFHFVHAWIHNDSDVSFSLSHKHMFLYLSLIDSSQL